MSVSHQQLSSGETKSFSFPQGNFYPQTVSGLPGPHAALSEVFVVDEDEDADSVFVEEEFDEDEFSEVAASEAPLVWLSVE